MQLRIIEDDKETYLKKDKPLLMKALWDMLLCGVVERWRQKKKKKEIEKVGKFRVLFFRGWFGKLKWVGKGEWGCWGSVVGCFVGCFVCGLEDFVFVFYEEKMFKNKRKKSKEICVLCNETKTNQK